MRPRGHGLEALGRLARFLGAPGAEVGKVGIGDVCALPGQDAEEAEKHHDAELEDVLHAVDLEGGDPVQCLPLNRGYSIDRTLTYFEIAKSVILVHRDCFI